MQFSKTKMALRGRPQTPQCGVYQNMNINYENEKKEAKRIAWGICFDSRYLFAAKIGSSSLSKEGSISGRLQYHCLLGHEKANNQTEKSQD